MYNLSAIWRKRGYLNIGAWCVVPKTWFTDLQTQAGKTAIVSAAVNMHSYALAPPGGHSIEISASSAANKSSAKPPNEPFETLFPPPPHVVGLTCCIEGQLSGSTISLFDVTKSNDSDCFEFGPDSTSLIQAAFVPKSNVKINLKFAFWTPPIPPGSFSKAANLISNLKSRGKFSRSERQNSLIARWSRSVGFEWPRKT